MFGLQPGDQRASDGAEPQGRQDVRQLQRATGDLAARGQTAGRAGVHHPVQDTERRQHRAEILSPRRHPQAG